MLPEMPPEPPPEYVAFVVRRLAGARAEAGRLTGAERHADEVYPAAFADVALCWRWRRWLVRFDPDRLLAKSLRKYAKRWRDEQIYPVDVAVVHTGRPAPGFVSIALRKAALLAPTARPAEQPTAEAAIAWAWAYRRYRWRRLAWTAATTVAAVIAVVQALPDPPA